MTTPAPPAVLHARQVVKDLQAAEAKLCNAQAGTDDRFVADFIGDARKDLRVALKRAQATLKDVDLKTAQQAVLGLDGPTHANQGE